MGNNAIISVMALIVIFSIINTNINRQNNQSALNSYGYVRYTAARDIARNSVQITLRKIVTDLESGIPIPSSFSLNGNIDNGSYSVNVTNIDDGEILRLVSRGKFEDTVYTVRTTLKKNPKPWPQSSFNSALGIFSTPVRFRFQPSANGGIDGRDHDSLGNLKPAPRNDVAGIAVRTSGDRDSIYKYAGSDTTKIVGNPRVSIDTAISNPETFVDELIAMADYTFQTPFNSGGGVNTISENFGSANNPKIVYVNGNDSNIVKFTGNKTGWGILIVRGSIEFAGGYTWRGLVIGYGNTMIDFKVDVGTPQIVGSFIFGGAPNSKFDMRGNGKIKYSRDALMKAKNVPKLIYYSIVDWYE